MYSFLLSINDSVKMLSTTKSQNYLRKSDSAAWLDRRLYISPFECEEVVCSNKPELLLDKSVCMHHLVWVITVILQNISAKHVRVVPNYLFCAIHPPNTSDKEVVKAELICFHRNLVFCCVFTQWSNIYTYVMSIFNSSQTRK